MRSILICTALIGTLVSSAFAHTGVGQTDSLASGIPRSGSFPCVPWAAYSVGRKSADWRLR